MYTEHRTLEKSTPAEKKNHYSKLFTSDINLLTFSAVDKTSEPRNPPRKPKRAEIARKALLPTTTIMSKSKVSRKSISGHQVLERIETRNKGFRKQQKCQKARSSLVAICKPPSEFCWLVTDYPLSYADWQCVRSLCENLAQEKKGRALGHQNHDRSPLVSRSKELEKKGSRTCV